MSSSRRIEKTSARAEANESTATFAWPPTPPNSEGFRSTVQTTIRRTAKELGLPEGVPPPIIAIPPTPGIPTWPKTTSGVELTLPDIILPPDAPSPWEKPIPIASASASVRYYPPLDRSLRLPPLPRLPPPPVPKYDPSSFPPIKRARQGAQA